MWPEEAPADGTNGNNPQTDAGSNMSPLFFISIVFISKRTVFQEADVDLWIHCLQHALDT